MGMPVIVASNIDRCDAVTDIVQSVALEPGETALISVGEGKCAQQLRIDIITIPLDTEA